MPFHFLIASKRESRRSRKTSLGTPRCCFSEVPSRLICLLHTLSEERRDLRAGFFRARRKREKENRSLFHSASIFLFFSLDLDLQSLKRQPCPLPPPLPPPPSPLPPPHTTTSSRAPSRPASPRMPSSRPASAPRSLRTSGGPARKTSSCGGGWRGEPRRPRGAAAEKGSTTSHW